MTTIGYRPQLHKPLAPSVAEKSDIKVGLSQQTVAAPQTARQLTASTPTAAHFQGYHGIQGKPLRFMGAGEDFNTETFLTEADVYIDLLIETAKQLSKGSVVTTADLGLALIRDFEEDMAQQEGSKEFSAHDTFSVLGRYLSLGKEKSPEAHQDFQRILKEIRRIKTELEALQEEQAVPEAQRTGALSKEVEDYLKDTALTTREMVKKTREKNEKEEAEGLRVPNINTLLQVIDKTGHEDGIEQFRDLLRYSKVNFSARADAFFPDSVKEKAAGALSTGRPIDITRQVQRKPAQTIPGIEEDIRELVSFINQPVLRGDHTTTKRLLVVTPNILSKQLVVENIAAQMRQVQPNPESQGFVTSETKVFQIDFQKFMTTVKEDEIFPRLLETVQKLATENDRTVLHLSNFEWALQKYGGGLEAFFDKLTEGDRLKLLLTVDENFADTDHHRAFVQNASQRWSESFLEKNIEPPQKEDVTEYIQANTDVLKRAHPDMHFSPAAIEAAVDYCYTNSMLVPEDVLNLLSFTAQRLRDAGNTGQAGITEKEIQQVIHGGLYAKGLAKPKNNVTYRILSKAEIEKDMPATLTGIENIQRGFDQLKSGLSSPEMYENLGIPHPRAMMIMGSAGTGRTSLLKDFARQTGLPTVYVDCQTLQGREPNAMINSMERVFRAAKTISRRQVAKGNPPHVFVAFDNLEAGIARSQQGNMEGALSSMLAMQLEGLQKEGNKHIVVIGTAGSEKGLVQQFADRQIVQGIEQIYPPMGVSGREKQIRVLLEKKEQELGQKVFEAGLSEEIARSFDYIPPKSMEVIIAEALKIAIGLNGGKTEGLSIKSENLNQAVSLLSMGAENRALFDAIQPAQQEWTAYHEVAHTLGHAFTNRIAEYPHETNGDLLAATVIPRGQSLGSTSFGPDTNSIGAQSKTQMFNRIVMAEISRVMESMLYGENGTGVSGDQQTVTETALAMSAKYMMLNNKIQLPGKISEWKLQELPDVVQKDVESVINAAQKAGHAILTHYREFVEECVMRLIGPDGKSGEETISGKEFMASMEAFENSHPGTYEKCREEVQGIKRQLFQESSIQQNGERIFKPRFTLATATGNPEQQPDAGKEGKV